MATKNYQPHEKAQIDLLFINRFNNAGVNNTPVKYKTVYEAKQTLSAPLFWKMFKKLTTQEKERLLNAE